MLQERVIAVDKLTAIILDPKQKVWNKIQHREDVVFVQIVE